MDPEFEKNSFLDLIRLSEGEARCRALFDKALQSGAQEAALLLNEKGVSFACVFILREQIERVGLAYFFPRRLSAALQVVSDLSTHKDGAMPSVLCEKKRYIQAALQWMITDAALMPLADLLFEKAVDTAFSVLVGVYKDNSLLEAACEIVFCRYRNRRLIHNLLSAFFKSHDPATVYLIARRLSSECESERELARALLSSKVSLRTKSCEDYLDWLSENEEYIYFTDETLQQSSKPCFIKVDLERKYLNKAAEGYERVPIIAESEEEFKCLQVFNHLGEDERRLLADFINEKFKGDEAGRKSFLQNEIQQQLSCAKEAMLV